MCVARVRAVIGSLETTRGSMSRGLSARAISANRTRNSAFAPGDAERDVREGGQNGRDTEKKKEAGRESGRKRAS